MIALDSDGSQWVVKEEDASYPGVGEILPMQANHRDICKFDDAEDDGYKQVRAKIKQAMEATEVSETSTVRESRSRGIQQTDASTGKQYIRYQQ